jgi:hypothetical protein
VRILLDENLPRKLAGHECRTVVECGWSGKNNGELLVEADPLFDLLLTLDKNLPYQQHLTTKRIAMLIVRAHSSRIQDLLPILPECLAALASIHPGKSSASAHRGRQYESRASRFGVGIHMRCDCCNDARQDGYEALKIDGLRIRPDDLVRENILAEVSFRGELDSITERLTVQSGSEQFGFEEVLCFGLLRGCCWRGRNDI